jgi:hypothetical protein
MVRVWAENLQEFGAIRWVSLRVPIQEIRRSNSLLLLIPRWTRVLEDDLPAELQAALRDAVSSEVARKGVAAVRVEQRLPNAVTPSVLEAAALALTLGIPSHIWLNRLNASD